MIPGFWKEVENWIEFSDLDEIDATVKQKHHYRSYTIEEETKYVTDSWKMCLTNANVLIPAYKIKIED